MPASSEKQRRFMAMCEHNPEKVRGKCPDMSQKKFHEYASAVRRSTKGSSPFTAQELARGFRKVA